MEKSGNNKRWEKQQQQQQQQRSRIDVAFEILKEQQQQTFGELTAYFRQIRQRDSNFALPALESSGLLLPPSVEYENVARKCTNCCITPDMHLSMINSSFVHGLLNGLWLKMPIKTMSALPLFATTIHVSPADVETSIGYFLEESSSSSPMLLPASWLMNVPVKFLDLAIRSNPDMNDVNVICNVTAVKTADYASSPVRPSSVSPGSYYALRVFYRTVDVCDREMKKFGGGCHNDVAANLHKFVHELLSYLFKNFAVKDLRHIDESRVQTVQQHEPYCKLREGAFFAARMKESKMAGDANEGGGEKEEELELSRSQILPGYSTILESMVHSLSLLLPNKNIKEINDDLVRFVVEGSPESAFEDFKRRGEKFILDPDVLAASTSPDIRKYAQGVSGSPSESRLLTLARRYRRTCIEYAMINPKMSGYSCDCESRFVS